MTEALQPWLLDALNDGVVVLDGDSRVEYINPAAEKMLQLRREDVVGGALGNGLPTPPAVWMEAYQEAMASRTTQPLPPARLGNSVPGGRMYEGKVHPRPGGGIGIIFCDVTERQQTNEALRVRTRAIDASRSGVVITDPHQPDNPIIYVNPAFEQMTGYSAAEVLGRNCRFLQRDDRDQPGVDELRAAISQGRDAEVVLRNYRRDGTLFYNELYLSPVHNECGELTHFVGVQIDVTERRRTEEELMRRNTELEAARSHLKANVLELAAATKAKDRFLAVVSHEMRTPLNAILGYADLLGMGVGGELNEAQQAHVDRIRVGGTHLLDLINDVLDLTRADARKLEVDLRPVDVEAAVEEVVALLESQAEAKGLTLRAESCGSESPRVLADLRRMRQVLTNLVGNAIKFTEKGSVVLRCTRSEDGKVLVAVSDTGIGIAPEALPRIFGEFYQADGNLTRSYGGTGLGLAIAQRFARLMGGDVLVESEQGRGSTFTLVLPTAEEGSETQTEVTLPHGLRVETRESERSPVVVVAFGEREDSLAELGNRVHPTVRVVGTTNADEVPELARREKASLVVLDIGCQEGVAWDAAYALREDPELAATAVLLLPCIPQPVVEESTGSLDLGWVSVVPKPFTASQLAHAVSNAAKGAHERTTDGTSPPAYDVLVVDDDPDSRRVATKFLSTVDAQVREAPDGESALVEMRRQVPDVVVLDLMMPVLDGFGVLATMRADPLLARTPVVVLTAKSLTEAERRFLSRTAVKVLQKGEHRLSDVAALVLRAAMGAEAVEAGAS